MRRRIVSLLLIPLVLLAQAMGGVHSHGAAEMPHFHFPLLSLWPGHGHDHPSPHCNSANGMLPDSAAVSDEDDDHDDDAVYCGAAQGIAARPTSLRASVLTPFGFWLPPG